MVSFKLGPVKPHVQAAADRLGPQFGFTNIGGWRAVGSVSGSDHPKGLALDFMTTDRSKGDALVAHLIPNAAGEGVKYIIWWRRIWQNGEWKSYSGPSAHTDHVHVSFNAIPGTGGVSIPGVTIPASITDPSSWPVIRQIEGLSERLSSGDFWQRIGLYVLGFLLVVAGIAFLLRKPAAQVVKGVIPSGK